MMNSKLLQLWQIAANDLHLEILVPFSLTLKSGRKLTALFLLRQFGAANGMLVFSNDDGLISLTAEIVDAGYGYSVLDEPYQKEVYQREEYVELLADWGWSDDNKLRPEWLPRE